MKAQRQWNNMCKVFKKQIVYQDFCTQQESFKNLGEILFQPNRSGINHLQNCTFKNIKRNSPNRSKMITNRNLDLDNKEGKK